MSTDLALSDVLDPVAEAVRAVEVDRAWRRREVLARAGVAERIDGDLGTVVRLPYG